MLTLNCPCGAEAHSADDDLDDAREREILTTWMNLHAPHGQPGPCGSTLNVELPGGDHRYEHCLLPAGHPGWHQNQDRTASWADEAATPPTS